MPSLSNREKRQLSDAFEKAALDAGYRMQVRHQFGDKLEFSDFAQDLGTGMALNYVIDNAVQRLRSRGVKVNFGSGHRTWLDDVKPDRYTVIINGKKIYGAVSWDF